MGASACTCMHAHAHACTCTWTYHVYIAILISKASSKFHCQVSLPALQVAFGIAVAKLLQSFIANWHCQVSFAMEQPLDPEVAFGPQQEWESPRQERPWLGHNAASLIPDGANEEEIIEALELWGMPAEAWPQMDTTNKAIFATTLFRRRISQTSMCILEGRCLQHNLHMRSTLTSASGCLLNLSLGQWPTLMGLATLMGRARGTTTAMPR